MIRNNRKSKFGIPASLTDASNDLEQIATGNRDLIDDKIYKGEYKEDGKKKYEVREALKEIYYNKCAYCEIKEYKPEIEHYRPKKKVTGLKGHSGYYWLCYEWTNLLPSCRYCNTEGGKGNKFPIKGKRVSKPCFDDDGLLNIEKCKAERSPLKDEESYLLHPEVDSPEDYFLFKPNGKIQGIGKDKRGQSTIKICDLNRDNLLYRRQEIIDRLLTRIKDAFIVYFEKDHSDAHLKIAMKQIFSGMDKAAKPESEFALISSYCLEHFDGLIIPLLITPGQKRFASNAMKAYKAGNL